jgi:hypothetical protein
VSGLVDARFVERSAKLFDEVASRPQIGKAPPTIGLIVLSDPTAMSRLNASRLMKLHNSAAQMDFQTGVRDGKLDDIGEFLLVC